MALLLSILAVGNALPKIRDIDIIVKDPSEYNFCGAHDVFEDQLANDPVFAHNHEVLEQHIQDTLKNGGISSALQQNIQQIPVVVNILFNPSRTNAANIPDSQVISQMKLVNEQMLAQDANIPNNGPPGDFGDVLANMQFKFRLNYITRTQTSSNGFSSNNNIKYTSSGGKSCELCSTNMNFWIGELSGGLIGYAQFPGGNVNTDGIVMTTRAIGDRNDQQSDWGPLYLDPFGNNQFSHVTTHEIGHWINLRHIWGDTTSCNRLADFVQDTPGASGPNRGCPAYPRITCTDPEMSMNYMDYTDSRCSYMFSEGQKARSKAVFGTSSRDSYIEAVMPDSKDEFVTYVYMVTTEEAAISNPCISGEDSWVESNIGINGGYTYVCMQKSKDARLKAITDIKMVKSKAECDAFGVNYYYSLDSNTDLHFCWNKEFANDVSEVVTDIIFSNPLLNRDGYVFDSDIAAVKVGLKLGYKKEGMIFVSDLDDNVFGSQKVETATANVNVSSTTVITIGVALIVIAILMMGFIARAWKKKKVMNNKLNNEKLIYGSSNNNNTIELNDTA